MTDVTTKTKNPEDFAFTAENMDAAKAVIAKYPDGWQASAVMPLLDIAQRQNGGHLTQAAMESAWGTSRFAREGNNLFGQWCYQPGCGIVPKRRREGQVHEVASFDVVDAAVASYLRNINSHRAYADLRAARADLRAANQPVTGNAMANHLLRYSERGLDYVEEIQSMIRVNKLAVLDGV